MTLNQKPSEAGWFYHAPARSHKNDEAALYPAMSQIPGLTDEDSLPPDEDMPRPLFKDTDTKYIRLAKQGGRQNLLVIKENSGEKKEPVGYPRNEWFYLADNALEAQQEKKDQEEEYAFLRPDYMVHEAFQPETDQAFNRPGRGPIGYDRLSAFEREGKNASDKTVKLPELIKPGYGIRSAKPMRVPKHNDRNKPPSAPNEQGRQRLKYLPLPGSDKQEKATISKILSYGYDRDWHDQVVSWQNKQDLMRENNRMMMMPPGQEKIASEYTSSFARKPVAHVPQQIVKKPETSSARSNDSRPHVKQNESQRLREAKLKKPQEKAPFKLARFKNIPAKTESHRPIPQQVA